MLASLRSCRIGPDGEAAAQESRRTNPDSAARTNDSAKRSPGSPSEAAASLAIAGEPEAANHPAAMKVNRDASLSCIGPVAA